MEKIMSFSVWSTLEEGKQTLKEAEGISKAVHGALHSFFKEHSEGSFEQAKEYVASKVKGWELSEEDFEEAKKSLKESKTSEENEESKLDEGKMKEIDLIAKECKTKAEFEVALKKHLKETGKGNLVNDKEFIDAMVSDWKPNEE